MHGHNRTVRFSEGTLFKYRRVSIPFGENLSLQLSIETTPEELETLSRIIRILHNSAIRITTLHPHAIKQFIIQIKQLLELDCMAKHQAYIQTSARSLFCDLISQIPKHPTEYYDTRFTTKAKACNMLDEKIAMINAQLAQINAVNLRPIRSLQTSAEQYKTQSTTLPKTLTEFIQSIDIISSGNLYTWDEYFETHTLNTLHLYLNEVTVSIQQLTDEVYITEILSKLNKFILFLNNTNDKNQLNMFSEVAAHSNRSPLCSPHTTYEKMIKHQLNKLLASEPTTFRHDFLAFRQELSKASGTPYVQLNKLMRSLHFYVLEQFDENILPRTAHTNTVERYIYRCFTRTKHPLPDHLQYELDHLLSCYHAPNSPVPSREHYKFEFLNRLSHAIHLSPEKTYAECYRSTTASSKIEIQMLMTAKSCSFFGKHRFKHFITELLSEEPDYERSDFSQNAYLNNRAHDDADRFSC